MKEPDSLRMEESLTQGRALLARPLLPLVRIVQFIYLSGPFKAFSEVLDQLKEPIDHQGTVYDDPRGLLEPLLPVLRNFEALKRPAQLKELPVIVDRKKRPLNPIKAVEAWVRHQILLRELETINSLLCEPRACTLCCTGPAAGQRRFQEIPLTDTELGLFPLERIDTPESQQTTGRAEPALERDGRPFYQDPAALYHWKNGWGLVLPHGESCPLLDQSKARCRAYSDRPQACRQAQLAATVVIPLAGQEKTFCHENALRAAWACPYVRELREEIDAFAISCELTPRFVKE